MEDAPEYLYIGQKLVDLLPVQGQFFPFVPGKTVVEVPSVKSTNSALKRLQDNTELGSDYARVYQPALPSADLLLKPGTPAESPLPISVKSDKAGERKVIQSGKRSGVIRVGDAWYRLKGCGNLTSGFVVEQMAFPEDGRELRGCCFEHTLARELFMSDLIRSILRPYGYEAGNEPVGYWKYESDPSDTVKFELPLIGKFCGVYRTLGEKRLGSHLLGGLELLVGKLTPYFDLQAVTALFPPSRVINDTLIHPRLLLSTSGPLDGGPFLDEFTKEGVYRFNGQLFDMLTVDFSACVRVRDFTLDWIPQSGVSRLDHAECSSVSKLTALLLTLAYRVGREAGEVKRHLQDHEVSWGYFIDHNPFEPHCNAHPNNFLILNEAHDRVTAPVDFDMAFTFRGFINTIEEGTKGFHDYTLFQSFLNSERGALEEALMGMENMANFNYASSAGEPSALSIAVRDLLLLGYREGFDLREDRHPVTIRGNRALWSAIEMCLHCSSDYIEY